jgi:hypothetical protein
VRVPDHVVSRSFAAETVILNLETGKYHGLNTTGGRMLQVLQHSGTVRASAPALAEEFGQPEERIVNDLSARCADLAERGLLVFDDAGDS